MRLAVAVVAGVVVLFVLRLFVGDVYRVETRSMRPTILAGDGAREWVLVRHGAPDPLRRHDLVVVHDDESGGALVKRLVGLPGETLQLVDGDLLIDGERLPLSTQRPPLVPVFDSQIHELGEYFFGRTAPESAVRFAGQGAHLATGDVPRGSDAGLLFFRMPLMDDHIGPDGERVTGTVHVDDAVLEVEFTLHALPEPSQAELRLRLVEKGDTFEARLVPGTDGSPGSARLVRRPGAAGEPEETLDQADFDLDVDESVVLTLWNADDHLALDVGRGDQRRRLLAARYAGNRPYTGAAGANARPIAPRAAFGGSGAELAVTRVRLSRDTSWLARGRFSLAEPLTLGPDEVFVLGDDSAHSRDSRQFGPLPLSAVAGRPVAVVWPLRRARVLAGPEPGGE